MEKEGEKQMSFDESGVKFNLKHICALNAYIPRSAININFIEMTLTRARQQ